MSDEIAGINEDLLGTSWVSAEIFRLKKFVDVGVTGLHYAEGATEMVETIRKYEELFKEIYRFQSTEQYQEELRKAEELERFAKDEFKDGFPYLFGLATVRLWAIMESGIDDLLIAVLRERPETRQLPIIQKLKGPIVPFASSSASEQAEYIAELLKQEVKASLQSGVGRFEAILNSVGLGGPVPDEVRRVFLELSEIRHVLVHRRGKGDAKLLKDRCPWLPFMIGDSIRVRRPEFDCFCIACGWYCIELERRISVLRGDPHREARVQLLAFMEEKLISLRSHMKNRQEAKVPANPEF